MDRTRLGISVLCLAMGLAVMHPLAAQQPEFAAATIRPSSTEVPFDRDGKTETWPGSLRMQSVTVITCIKWAYGVQNNQISGPDWLRSEHFDIVAKADTPVGDTQMKLMLQALLAERFNLSFHRQTQESKAYGLTLAKGTLKLHPSADDAKSSLQNTASGTIAKATTMREFANFISGPLQTPVADETGLTGRYDFVLDFTPYLPEDQRSRKIEATGMIMAALQGELGLKLEARKAQVEVFVIDHIEQPTEN